MSQQYYLSPTPPSPPSKPRSKAPLIATGIGSAVLGLVAGFGVAAQPSTSAPVPTVTSTPVPGPTKTVTETEYETPQACLDFKDAADELIEAAANVFTKIGNGETVSKSDQNKIKKARVEYDKQYEECV